MRGQTMKNWWRQFVFCNNKISKKSNIAGKNEQNNKIYDFNLAQCYRQ